MRGLVRALAVAALVLAILVARVLWAGRAEHECGKSAEAQRAHAQAVACYRRAIGWYVPGSPYVERSTAALTRIAAQAEQAGDAALSLSARRALAAGLASARSVRAPHAPSQAPLDPSPLLSLLAFLGWLGFVASAFGLVLRGVDDEGRPRDAARYAAGLAAGFVVFALSLWLA
jgi:hypothetical protein